MHASLAGDSRPTLIFLHIPKTAGTTVQQVLRRQFPAEGVYEIYEGVQHAAAMEYLSGLVPAAQARIRLVMGHMHYGLHCCFPQAVYITLLRDPVERTISFYEHARRHADHYLHDPIVSQRMSLGELLQARLTTELDNQQTRLLGGGDPPVGECTRGLLEQARRNIQQHFAVAGLTERFDETLVLLGQLGGWHNVLYIKQNAAPRRSARSWLDAESLRVVQEHNALDIELYDWVQARFQAQVSVPGFGTQLAAFRALNTLYRLAYPHPPLRALMHRRLPRPLVSMGRRAHSPEPARESAR